MNLDKKWDCTLILVAKTKALISLAVTSKLICVFGFAYADCWVSHEEAHLQLVVKSHVYLKTSFQLHSTSLCQTWSETSETGCSCDITPMSHDARKPVFGVSDQV